MQFAGPPPQRQRQPFINPTLLQRLLHITPAIALMRNQALQYRQRRNRSLFLVFIFERSNQRRGMRKRRSPAS